MGRSACARGNKASPPERVEDLLPAVDCSPYPFPLVGSSDQKERKRQVHGSKEPIGNFRIPGAKDMLSHFLAALFVTMLVLLSAAVAISQQMPNPYGSPISLDNAKKAADTAIAEARKNKWTMAVAIVDPNGTLIYYEKLDNTQNGSAQVAIDKARS